LGNVNFYQIRFFHLDRLDLGKESLPLLIEDRLESVLDLDLDLYLFCLVFDYVVFPLDFLPSFFDLFPLDLFLRRFCLDLMRERLLEEDEDEAWRRRNLLRALWRLEEFDLDLVRTEELGDGEWRLRERCREWRRRRRDLRERDLFGIDDDGSRLLKTNVNEWDGIGTAANSCNLS